MQEKANRNRKSAIRNPQSAICRRAAGAFTLVEVVISLGLLSTIMAAFVVALNNSSDALMIGCAKGVISSQLDLALKTVEADLRETSGAGIDKTQTGLPPGQCAIVLSTARDSAGVFHVDSTGRPVWQAVVVYCPYVTAAGVSQLRRYVYSASQADFPFAFQSGEPVTAGEVLLRGQSGAVISVDRWGGNPDLPAGQKVQTLCLGLTEFEVTVGNPTTVRLHANCNTRRNRVIDSEETAYVAQRN